MARADNQTPPGSGSLLTDTSPTEDLVLEVLAARARQGERLWTFETRYGTALRSLQDRGLIEVMHGVVDGTVRAMLTDAGKEAVLSASYTSPALAALEELLSVAERIRGGDPKLDPEEWHAARDYAKGVLKVAGRG